MGYNLSIGKKGMAYHASKLFDISNKKLEILFSKFGSINKLAQADVRDIKRIKSIGKKTIEKVNDVLNSNILK